MNTHKRLEFISRWLPQQGFDDENEADESVQARGDISRKWDMIEPKKATNLGPEQYMVCGNLVYAFVLMTREWGMLGYLEPFLKNFYSLC